MKILLINTGVQPELIHFAEFLQSNNKNFIYATCSSISDTSRLLKNNLLPSKVRKLLRRRIIKIENKNIVRNFFFLEVVIYLTRERFVNLSRFFLSLRNFLFDVRVRFLVRQCEPTVIIQNASLGYFTLKYGSRKKIPIILSYPIAHHNWMKNIMKLEEIENPTWAPYLQGGKLSRHRRNLLDKEIAIADLVLVGSTFVKNTFLEEGIFSEKLKIVPLGVSRIENYRAVGRKKLDDGNFVILFMGQINQRKGLSYLLDGFQKANFGTAAKLNLVGTLTMGQSILKLIQNYENVEYHDHVSRDDMKTIFNQSDVFILPSLAEGFPLTAIEAMSNGLPAIVSENTFAYDVISNGINGSVIPSRNSDAIAEILKKLFEDRKLLHSMGENAQLTASNYTWDKYSRELYALVLSICDHD